VPVGQGGGEGTSVNLISEPSLAKAVVFPPTTKTSLVNIGGLRL